MVYFTTRCREYQRNHVNWFQQDIWPSSLQYFESYKKICFGKYLIGFISGWISQGRKYDSYQPEEEALESSF